MTKNKCIGNEKVITPIINKGAIKPVEIKSIHELQYELNIKIYTNIYTYNTLCNGIFICRGINGITGKKNSGKSSLCSHICVNLFFNDLLHFFHLFYSTYFDFENFLHKKNIENKFSSKISKNLKNLRKEFNIESTNFQELNQLLNYFTLLFIDLYDKKVKEKNAGFLLNYNRIYNNNQFSKKRIIYIDLDNSFYIERYKNMIYSSIEKIKKLINTYINFCGEKNSFLFLLLLDSSNFYQKQQLFNIYKNYTKEWYLFINLFNHYLNKYIDDITFFDVFKNLQILKIFNFSELVNVVHFICDHVEKYAHPKTNHFNKYIPSDLGAVVLDNLNYLHKSNTVNDMQLTNAQLKDKQPNDEQPNDEQPNNEQPNNEQPNNEQSNNEQPNNEQPNNEQPNNEQPNDEQPNDEQPNNKQLNSKHLNNKHLNNKKLNTEQLNNELKCLLMKLSKLSTEHKICVLITNNDSKYFKKHDEHFNKIYSKYVYHHIIVRFINQKNLFEHNYPTKKESKKNDCYTPSSDEGSDEMAENHDDNFCTKRYNQRYIKIKKKGKDNICFFEINEYGIETLLH
ncbi:conserved Plasmodium protein, unknown function [Plasmodium malariae]|uniref:P-loop containing nucleoside triphosphate hydrolase n=1 Tax=Plasmodium malariae TaxID=5858 RepID=A0A1A8WXH4_PLAMA|nr:conserved Plasmodium protein, unknown function [Plasmodium malariae]